jgi:hypothetical protein
MQHSFAHRHGQQQFPARPIFSGFTASVQKAIRFNPLGAITFAAQCVSEKEALFNYVDSLPIPADVKSEITRILMLEYARNN